MQSQEQMPGLSLEPVDSTANFNNRLNLNCLVDSAHVIYLSGSCLVFHNLFQNSSKFVPRIHNYEPVAMASIQTAEGIIAIASRPGNSACNTVQFYYGIGKKSIALEIPIPITIIDMHFLSKDHVLILGTEPHQSTSTLLQVSFQHSPKKIILPGVGSRIILADRKYWVALARGMVEFNIGTDTIGNDMMFKDKLVIDYTVLDNGTQIVATPHSLICYVEDETNHAHEPSSQHEIPPDFRIAKLVKVGANILVADKQQFTLSQFTLCEDKLQLVNTYSYSQKSRGTIVSMQVSNDEFNLGLAVEMQHRGGLRIEYFIFNLSILKSNSKFINPFVSLRLSDSDCGDTLSLQSVLTSEIYYLSGHNIACYSHMDNTKRICQFPLHESPKCLTVHPLGYQFVCVFESQIKFYQRIQQQIVEVWTETLVCTATKYTQAGLLVLSVFELGLYQLVLYNPNCYKRLRHIQNIHLKSVIQRIDLNQNDSQVAIFTSHDLFVHKLRSGEKVAEFKEKKDSGALAYDPVRKWLLSACKSRLLVCKKNDDYCLNFSSQQVVDIEEEISCIRIQENFQTLFIGTCNGKILYMPYPLRIMLKDTTERIYRVYYQSVKLHNSPVNELLLTNNCRSLLATVRHEGLWILKAKNTELTRSSKYNPDDVSSYNFIQTSSSSSLESAQERLKIMLQKRKAVFIELDEFKKDWDRKRAEQNQAYQIDNNRKQLTAICSTLQQISTAKERLKAAEQQLQSCELQFQQEIGQEQQKLHAKLLQLYKVNDDLQARKEQVQMECDVEYGKVVQGCEDNLKEVSQELEDNFAHFSLNFARMKDNLGKLVRKMQIEHKEEEEIGVQLKKRQMEALLEREADVYKRNNQLTFELTKAKKQMERFTQRREFLEHKLRYFEEEIGYSEVERTDLATMKLMLQEGLKELQDLTHKKEHRMKKYFEENKVLNQYQFIHNHFMDSTNRSLEFLSRESDLVAQNMNKVHKEISEVAETKETYQKMIDEKTMVLKDAKVAKKRLVEREKYIQLLLNEMQLGVDKVTLLQDDTEKAKQLKRIHDKYYIEKKLDALIARNEQGLETDEQINEQNKQNQQKITDILVEQKEYLERNMTLFNRHHLKASKEIHLNYLNYQQKNYDLIAECNVRKEQITKKKKIVNQLIASVREANLMLEGHPSSSTQTPKYSDKASSCKDLKLKQSINVTRKENETPFMAYERQLDEEQKARAEGMVWQSSQSQLWQSAKVSGHKLRKVLDISKIRTLDTGHASRRIRTAVKKKLIMQTVHNDACNELSSGRQDRTAIHKPRTALHRRLRESKSIRRLSRNKSNSKPTTCTSYSKSKGSLFL